MVQGYRSGSQQGPGLYFFLFPLLRMLALSSRLLPHGLNMAAPPPASGLCSNQKEQDIVLPASPVGVLLVRITVNEHP